jgi:hypothetical protein
MLSIIKLNDATPAHIQALIDSEVAENLTLEYKSVLPTGQSESSREFLYDVAAMANSQGGDIIFGIADRKGADDQSTGIADKLSEMKMANVQTDIDRLSNLIKDGISPRLTGFSMQPLSCNGNDVLIVRIPRSWNRPHMVTAGAVNKFYTRIGTQKNLMSVDEIRRSFLEQGELSRTIKQWRLNRAQLVSSATGPVSSGLGKTIMLFHVIPASAVTASDLLSGSWRFPEQEKAQLHVPNGITRLRYNGDGAIATASVGDDVAGHTQIFRSGVSEYADYWSGLQPEGSNQRLVRALKIEKQMIFCLKDAIRRLRVQGRTELIYVGFSLLGIKNCLICTQDEARFFSPTIIQDNIFSSPEVLVDITELEEPPYRKVLEPLADTMWQLSGREGSPHSVDGIWNPLSREFN